MPTKQQQHANLWESKIREECRDLRLGELASVDKNWEAPRIPDSSIPCQKSKTDFSGYAYDGRHIEFEAKATLTETRLPFDNIADHQETKLERAHEWGAISFIYALDGRRRRWVLPWPAVAFMQNHRSSFPFRDGLAYQKDADAKETWLDTWVRLEMAGLTERPERIKHELGGVA